MVVLYYTSTHFIDSVLETIKCIKDTIELHVIIEIAPESKTSTIIKVNDLSSYSILEDCEVILGEHQWLLIKKYFHGVASVKFIVHKDKRSLSISSLRVASVLGKYIKNIKAEVIHFDTVSVRSIGLYPYIFDLKVFITVHDPIPHSGEASWKNKLPKFVYYHLASGYFFYSSFAQKQFQKRFKAIGAPKVSLKLQPYTYVSQFITEEEYKNTTVLFYGRISLYKGIDILIEAIPTILKWNPNVNFVIAGKISAGYSLDNTAIKQFDKNVELMTQYLSTEDLVKIIRKANIVVCPYRDATQSGVLMTTMAVGKPVIATNVGAFPEYISDNINGFLAEPTPEAIAAKVIEALTNQRYKNIERNICSSYSEEIGSINRDNILRCYL
ncbi:glycosyltransferase [Pontibacter anaerobius]|uniref:Glycosyltransferase n=1 Tax=Pontibacter anaerobius TaxID=2993940 RepID=A0ABT3RIB9_9BACT|nr:glycosyltransferase [Pontibacter anaerobius]MCX2740980.1 glycosyltransferase [Pontibacter anaerobius]